MSKKLDKIHKKMFGKVGSSDSSVPNYNFGKCGVIPSSDFKCSNFGFYTKSDGVNGCICDNGNASDNGIVCGSANDPQVCGSSGQINFIFNTMGQRNAGITDEQAAAYCYAGDNWWRCDFDGCNHNIGKNNWNCSPAPSLS